MAEVNVRLAGPWQESLFGPDTPNHDGGGNDADMPGLAEIRQTLIHDDARANKAAADQDHAAGAPLSHRRPPHFQMDRRSKPVGVLEPILGAHPTVLSGWRDEARHGRKPINTVNPIAGIVVAAARQGLAGGPLGDRRSQYEMLSEEERALSQHQNTESGEVRYAPLHQGAHRDWDPAEAPLSRRSNTQSAYHRAHGRNHMLIPVEGSSADDLMHEGTRQAPGPAIDCHLYGRAAGARVDGGRAREPSWARRVFMQGRPDQSRLDNDGSHIVRRHRTARHNPSSADYTGVIHQRQRNKVMHLINPRASIHPMQDPNFRASELKPHAHGTNQIHQQMRNSHQMVNSYRGTTPVDTAGRLNQTIYNPMLAPVMSKNKYAPQLGQAPIDLTLYGGGHGRVTGAGIQISSQDL